MDMAKIRLSSPELDLVSDPSWILTKNSILKKVNNLLAELLYQQQYFIATNSNLLPPEVLSIPGKISRGENYEGLPYLILDHPRHFHREDIFAIRTMFWWGNFFSITLHLSGKYKIQLTEKIVSGYEELRSHFSICINQDQWDHRFNEENYKLIADLGKTEFNSIVNNKSFIKIGRTMPLQQWEVAGELLLRDFAFFLKKMGD